MVECSSRYDFLFFTWCGKIHASIRKNLISLFKNDLKESSYVFENFIVGSNDHAYKSTDHKYKLDFMGGTKVFKVTSGNIPASQFSFVPFLEIQSATKKCFKMFNSHFKLLVCTPYSRQLKI